MVEGAPLLREYGVYSLIEGSNPSLSAIALFPAIKLPNRLKGNDNWRFENTSLNIAPVRYILACNRYAYWFLKYGLYLKAHLLVFTCLALN